MKEERYKQLMEQVGMPESRSILQAFQQIANEVEQETIARIKDEITKEHKEQRVSEDMGRIKVSGGYVYKFYAWESSMPGGNSVKKLKSVCFVPDNFPQ